MLRHGHACAQRAVRKEGMQQKPAHTSPQPELSQQHNMVDDSFLLKKSIPKPAGKAAPKPARKRKHVQLFKMRRKTGKSFYSTAPDAPDGQ